MLRQVDSLPEPREKRRMKVVVASCSRTGTLGLFHAFKILGYRPYHLVEAADNNGAAHLKTFRQAVQAEHNRFLGLRRYDRADLDRWLGEYDCLIEVSSFLRAGALDAYLADPEVRFILTERDPDSWVASFNGSVGMLVRAAARPPLAVLCYFDRELYEFLYLCRVLYFAFSDGTPPGHLDNERALRRNYLETIQFIKERVPSERMCVIKLEDGLGWEQICPFLDKPIPDEPYPRGNDPEKFKKGVGGYMRAHVRRAMLNFAAVMAPVVGVGVWLAMRYGPAAADFVTKSLRLA